MLIKNKLYTTILFSIFCLFALIILIVLDILIPQINSPQLQNQLANSPSLPLITSQTPVYEHILYTECNHTIKQQITDQRYLNLNGDDILAQDKQLIWQEGQANIEYQISQLCPADAFKVHLIIENKKIALYGGPLGYQKNFIEYLDLDFQQISARWLAQLTAGGIEFASHEQFLMTLDNLDEIKRR